MSDARLANQGFAPALAWLRGKLQQAGASGDPELPPAFVELSNRFDLSRFEQHVLLLCVAAELDPQMPALFEQAHGARFPTFGLALTLFEEPSWEALLPGRPLRHWRLIEIHQPGALPLTASALRADERVVAYLNGLNALDDRLHALTAPLEMTGDASLSKSQREAIALLAERWQQPKHVVAQLAGTDADSKALVAFNAAQSLGLRLWRVPLAWLPTDPAELDQFARLWGRESRLSPIALLLDAQDRIGATPDADRSPGLARLLSQDLGPAVVSVREPRADVQTGPAIDVARPTSVEQFDAWRDALGSDSEPAAQIMAAQFNLNLPAIHDIVWGGLGTGRERQSRIWRASIAWTRPRMDQLATRLEPRAGWRDLVLPVQERQQLYSIVRHTAQRHVVYDTWGFRDKTQRGLGIAALFAGESGTGKTLAAEVLAHHLALNLYRIDLSAVVSKYIGETEKNLRRVFDAAEDGGSILFFDEADALFGKRTEVKDSHDRYANIEINYLLQRIETFSGLTILATNLKSAVDQAFMRRLRFVVNFPFPGQAERLRIWRHAIPRQAPVERDDPRVRVDFERLARLNFTGGSIHNIALHSAFLAATRRRRITQPLILEAVRAELRKLDRPVSEVDRLVAPPQRRAVPA